jgi:hypothetical protein
LREQLGGGRGADAVLGTAVGGVGDAVLRRAVPHAAVRLDEREPVAAEAAMDQLQMCAHRGHDLAGVAPVGHRERQPRVIDLIKRGGDGGDVLLAEAELRVQRVVRGQ